jgi:AAA+ superfamily predicted ATPase
MTDKLSVLDAVEFPDLGAKRRYEKLVGIDGQKTRLEKNITLVLDPHSIEGWVRKNGPLGEALAERLRGRQPVFILAGDVGTGKTEVAETVGDRVSRNTELPVTLYRLSLTSRGSGLVGEMTKLISNAFTEVAAAARAKKQSGSSRARAGTILFIDEADALAQSRETAQMHHEDRAGVNALIRGIDDLTRAELPVAVLLATNRVGALDPAVRRRAAEIIVFGRPCGEQRRLVLEKAFGSAFSKAQIDGLVLATGPSSGSVGFTYSDLTQRFLPALLIAAFPDARVSYDLAVEVLKTVSATPAFQETTGG